MNETPPHLIHEYDVIFMNEMCKNQYKQNMPMLKIRKYNFYVFFEFSKFIV